MVTLELCERLAVIIILIAQGWYSRIKRTKSGETLI